MRHGQMRQMRLPRAGGGGAPAAGELEGKKQLGERVDAGYRLACQLWLGHDIELAQDAEAAAAREPAAAVAQR